MTYVVAVDGGGTSTRSVVADRSGRCLGFAKTGSGNPVSAGEAVAAAAFAASLDAALTQAGVAAADVDCLLFSMAGSFTGAASPALAERLRGLGFRVTPAIEGDLLGVFCSGAAELTGYTLEAGTGSGAVRVEDGRIARTADGLGWLLGDEGSGFWFGHAVVRAACADLDRRGPATALTSLVLAEAGVTLDWSRAGEGRPAALPALMGYVYDLRPVQLSRFARLAFEA
ncbi:MAG: hypothetical protein LBR33_09020, partial [Propionibacteriaceae bacterium]|nr:hypothetical protein [Propionibacteriaceae bacterium]